MDGIKEELDIANDLIFRMAMDSVKWEKDREISAFTSSSNMITAISLLSVTFTAIVPIIVSKFGRASNFIFFVFVIILIQLFISLFLTLLVQKRYIYNTFPSPNAIYKHIISEKTGFASEEGLGAYLDTYDNIFMQLKKNNDIRITHLKHSQFLLKSTIISSFVFLVLGIAIFI